MNRSACSAGTRGLAVALFSLVSVTCKSAQTHDNLIDTPVAEHEIYVTLPAKLVTERGENNSLRRQYSDNGRRALGHVQPRCVVKGARCRTVAVRITAVEGGKYLDPVNGPKKAQLIAWVENLGDETTYDGFEPSTKYVYALVVAPRAAGGTAPILHTVGFSMDGSRSTITQAPYGAFNACHYYKRPLVSEADFRACDRERLYLNKREARPLTALVTVLSTWSLSPAADDPTWFACSSGCCGSTYQAQ